MSIEDKKMQTLAQIEGYADIMDLIEACHTDSVIPAICMNEDCDYSEGMEPDQREGWCCECDANTMKSALVLKGII